MRILIGPDLHCWPTTYEHASKGEPSTRLIEWKSIAQAILEIIKIEKPAVAFFPGDLFNVASPKATAVIEIISFFRQIEALDCTVIACSGNHDFTGPGETNFVDVIGFHGREARGHWGITKISCVKIPDYDMHVLIVPYMKPTLLDPSGKPETVSKKLLELSACESKAENKILMTHWAVKEAIYANGFGPKHEPVYALDDLKTLGYDVCIMGHVHAPQVLSKDPLIIHPGTAILTELNEASIAPNVYLYNTKSKELTAKELPARKIAYFRFTEKIYDFASREWEKEIPDVKDKIVVAKYEVPENIASTIDHQIIVETIYQKGAFHVEGVFPTIIRKERNRGMEIDHSLSRLDAFSKWYDTTGVKPELKTKALTKFEELERQV